jgi:outer membrane protein TolC
MSSRSRDAETESTLNRHPVYLIGLVASALVVAVPAHAQLLTLDEALRLAEMNSPRLAAQRHALTATEEQTLRAAELPDPKLRLGIENLPVTGDDRFRYDRDFMTMRTIGVMQEFPNSDKRAARGARAERTRDVERAMLDSQRATLQRDIAMAWLDAHFSERAHLSLRRLVEQLDAQADAVTAAIARGRQGAAEGLMLRGAVEQARDRVLDQERLVARSRLALAALVGDWAQRPLGPPPNLDRISHGANELLTRLHEHPHLRLVDAREDLARAEVDLTRASKRSDWSVEVGYGQRRPAFDNMLTVMVAIELPWQSDRRQDRDIASRLAELEQARALREDARRVHEAELRGWLADYDAATRRLERYRAALAPLASERAEAALAAYRGGRGELAPVLEAQRGITETELAALAIEAERGKAWANLNYLYPHEVRR